MNFFRVETFDHQGPYTNNLELTIMQWLEKEDVLDNTACDCRYEQYMRTHPTLFGDDNTLFKCYKNDIYCSDKQNFVFGFISLEQLDNWFCLEQERQYLKHYNFSITQYSSSLVYSSEYQAIADKTSLKLINRINF